MTNTWKADINKDYPITVKLNQVFPNGWSDFQVSLQNQGFTYNNDEEIVTRLFNNSMNLYGDQYLNIADITRAYTKVTIIFIDLYAVYSKILPIWDYTSDELISNVSENEGFKTSDSNTVTTIDTDSNSTADPTSRRAIGGTVGKTENKLSGIAILNEIKNKYDNPNTWFYSALSRKILSIYQPKVSSVNTDNTVINSSQVNDNSGNLPSQGINNWKVIIDSNSNKYNTIKVKDITSTDTSVTITDNSGTYDLSVVGSEGKTYTNTDNNIQIDNTNSTINSSNIGTNTTNIATNTSGIATNKTDIGTNKTDIGTNKTDIGKNKDNIQTNSDNIAVNLFNINANEGDIDGNTTDIATNKTDIGNNTTNITSNTSSIATNTTNISTNTSGIATNKTDIGNNTTNITDNSADISTNTATISANTVGIGNNTGDISTINSTFKVKDITSTNGSIGITKTNGTYDLAASGGGDKSYTNTDNNIQIDNTANTINSSNITTNTNNITSLGSGIQQNVTDISTNKTDIGTNTSDIANINSTYKITDLDSVSDIISIDKTNTAYKADFKADPLDFTVDSTLNINAATWKTKQITSTDSSVTITDNAKGVIDLAVQSGASDKLDGIGGTVDVSQNTTDGAVQIISKDDDNGISLSTTDQTAILGMSSNSLGCAVTDNPSTVSSGINIFPESLMLLHVEGSITNKKVRADGDGSTILLDNNNIEILNQKDSNSSKISVHANAIKAETNGNPYEPTSGEDITTKHYVDNLVQNASMLDKGDILWTIGSFHVSKDLPIVEYPLADTTQYMEYMFSQKTRTLYTDDSDFLLARANTQTQFAKVVGDDPHNVACFVVMQKYEGTDVIAMVEVYVDAERGVIRFGLLNSSIAPQRTENVYFQSAQLYGIKGTRR